MDIKWDLYLFFRFASVENPYGPKSRPLHGFQAAEACNHTQRREGLIFYPVAPCPKISLTFSYGDSIMNSGVAICALQYSMPPGIQLNQSIGFCCICLQQRGIGCKAQRVGHCEVPMGNKSGYLEEPKFLPEPETEIPVCHANSLYPLRFRNGYFLFLGT